MASVGQWVEEIITGVISGLLVIGGGIVLGRLRKKGHDWADAILYGVVGSASVAVLICAIFVTYFTLTGHAVFANQQLHITQDNVGPYLKDWLYKSGYGPSDVPQDKWTTPNASFSFRFPVENHFVIVERRGASLIVWTQTDSIPEAAKLPDNRLNALTETIRIQTAKLNMNYWDQETARNRWTIWAHVRIRDDMEDNFLETALRLHSAALAVEQTIKRETGNR